MSKTPYELLTEELAKGLCMSRLAVSGNTEILPSEITEHVEEFWSQHIPDARAAIDLIHARTMEPSEEMKRVGAGFLHAAKSSPPNEFTRPMAAERFFQAMHAVGPTAKPEEK